jgi:hypothetical protein
MIGSTPAGMAMSLADNTYGGGDLMQRSAEEIDAIRRKRMNDAKSAGYSPAGQSLASSFGGILPGTS